MLRTARSRLLPPQSGSRLPQSTAAVPQGLSQFSGPQRCVSLCCLCCLLFKFIYGFALDAGIRGLRGTWNCYDGGEVP
jgi:hypothetical protein